MDLDDTIQEVLQKFVKDITTNAESEAIQTHIEAMKWQLLCIFASSQNIYEAPTSMEEVKTNPNKQQR
jgi:hypothetical protein